MDKTLEIVLVAVVIIISAAIIIGLVNGRVNSLEDTSDQKTNSASCTVLLSQIKAQVDCSEEHALNSGELRQLRDNYRAQCRTPFDDTCVCPAGTEAADSGSAC